MIPGDSCRDDAQKLRRLAKDIDDCLARDIPALSSQWRALQARCQRSQPVDRGLDRLHCGLTI